MTTELTIATNTYEHVAPLFDGRVTIDGVEATLETAPIVTDIFRDLLAGRYDIAELGLTYLLRSFDVEDVPLMALPIFPARNFRHESVFVNTAAGIREPADLAGRTIGEFPFWGSDPGVWIKGILADDFGVRHDQSRWVIGGTDRPVAAVDWIPQPVPAGLDVRRAEEGQTLSALLETGQIDALISVDVPQAFLNGSARIARLFPDYETVERDYYRRTGIFPQMHVIAVRPELVDDTDMLRSVYRAFVEAKELVQQQYRHGARKQHMEVLTPWFSSHFDENRKLLGEDWWPYGLAANRTAIDTFLRYHHEQGLSQRLVTCADIFVPEFLDS